MQDDPINRSIISRIFDLITDNMFFQEGYPRHQEFSGKTRSAVKSKYSDDARENSLSKKLNNEDWSCQRVEYDVEISSSATIKWCSSIALHLLQLSLNINETRTKSLNLRKINSENEINDIFE